MKWYKIFKLNIKIYFEILHLGLKIYSTENKKKGDKDKLVLKTLK